MTEITQQNIINSIASYLITDPSNINNKSRKGEVVRFKKYFAYFASKYLKSTDMEISKIIGCQRVNAYHHRATVLDQSNFDLEVKKDLAEIDNMILSNKVVYKYEIIKDLTKLLNQIENGSISLNSIIIKVDQLINDVKTKL